LTISLESKSLPLVKLPVPPLIARMRAIIYISAILLMTLIPIGAFGHPHVFIDNSISIVFDEHGLAGFGIEWAFDEMFSAMIIHNYDTNENGKFEAGEIEEIKKGAFSNLRKFDYFTFVKINTQPFKIQFVKNFSAATVEDRLVYRFFIPCHVRAVDSFKEVKISIYDREFYCSVFLARIPVRFENATGFDYHYDIGKNKKEAYYFGQVYPDEVTLKFRVKNG